MPLPAWYFHTQNDYINAAGRTVHPRKQHHALLWPNDRSRSTWGRLRDLATGKGPDIFLASNPNRNVRASDGPSRPRWTGFPASDNPQGRLADGQSWLGDLPWTTGRADRPFYDFRARRFRRAPYDGMWVDARYLPRSRQPAAVTTWPDIYNPVDIVAGGYQAQFDPRNFGSNGVAYGVHGVGGDYYPPVDGFPPPGGRWME